MLASRGQMPPVTYTFVMETVGNGHAVVECTQQIAAGGEPRARVDSAPRIALTWLDQQAISGLVDGDAEPLLAVVRDSASALAGPDRDQARVRLLARDLASMRARQSLVESGLDESVRVGNDKRALLLDKLLTSCVRRLAMLLAEHRLTCTAETRPQIIAVQNAAQVVVQAGPR